MLLCVIGLLLFAVVYVSVKCKKALNKYTLIVHLLQKGNSSWGSPAV